ncbi:relaxase/mobilization nuclease domain-containing protein [Devosia riboflavina]|uniref:relaxase/mobilization nuclease domain-containing protein n=1 Tax=Devosia riboflavina TaxID=46914 RepID=UPI00068AEB08|nr:relaxase/mobilization nuclease domain-containing protein [Devosia riboflavina]
MILKGSQRAGGKALAIHLLRTDENDHVQVHQVRGFVRNNVMDAFKEAYAISRGTKCKQFLFSLSLSPPALERVPVEVFERAIEKIEVRLGLTGQPRAIVFHEKDGRRHAHCVWSRIDPKTMRARQMGHFKTKLTELSRELYLEHRWKMPSGLAKFAPRNPLNFSLAEWQQAKRMGRDATRIKALFQEAWAISDSGAAFERALEERGYHLARGDRRGFVAVDVNGEIFSISRWCGVPTKLVADRLKHLPLSPVKDVAKSLQTRVDEKLKAFDGELTLQFETAQRALKVKRDALVEHQRQARSQLEEHLRKRWRSEEIQRASRLRRGLLGIWDWFTGRKARTMAANEIEVRLAKQRDNEERQLLIDHQLKVRRSLQNEIRSLRRRTETLADKPVRARPRTDIPTATIAVTPRRAFRRGPQR